MRIKCACGCGEMLEGKDNRGRKVRFVYGHANKNKKFSDEHRKKISIKNKGRINTKEQTRKGVETRMKNGSYVFSEETKKKLREKRKLRFGDKAPTWSGGISFEPYSVDWTQTLKRAIRERDKYLCQLCGDYGNYVHHIDYNKLNCNCNNLICLCQSCHNKTNFNRNSWINKFKVLVKEKKQ